MRYKITLSYDGAGFRGWQIQPSEPSVQEALERALGVLLSEKIAVTGAGRTDTAVNAFHYVAHFDSGADINCRQLAYRLNAILPKSVSVHSVEPVAEDFHARFDARRREYSYFLHRRKDPFVGRYSYFYGYPELDFEAMNKAAEALLGRHDFACFEKTGADTKTSVCTVFEAYWAPYTPALNAIAEGGAPMAVAVEPDGYVQDGASGLMAELAPDADKAEEPVYWYFRISADRFLRNMVRAVVGTLLEIGRGKRTPESLAEIVGPVLPDDTPAAPAEGASRRSLAGESVPGHALFLSKIEY